MTDATTKTRTTKAPGTAPSSLTDNPTADPGRLFSDFVEHGLARAKETHERLLAAVETFEEVFTNAARGSTDCQARMVEMARANANAAYDLANELMAAESLAQLIECSANGTRRHIDTAAAQLKELSGLARKVAADTTEPISNMSRVFNHAA
jgi:hypothetical protein